MQIPLQLEIRDVERTAALEGLLREKVARLERFCDHITGCRIAIERPHRHESHGNPYRVRIDLSVPPKHEIVVTKGPRDHAMHDDLAKVINNTFHAAERRLKELVQRQRDEVKARREPRALVARIFKNEGYGFLRTLEGREIYFHRNSVVGDEFERLAIGTEVRFARTLGEKGPQATTVKVVGKPGERANAQSGRGRRP
jgi:cold shock CspA family protein